MNRLGHGHRPRSKGVDDRSRNRAFKGIARQKEMNWKRGDTTRPSCPTSRAACLFCSVRRSLYLSPGKKYREEFPPKENLEREANWFFSPRFTETGTPLNRRRPRRGEQVGCGSTRERSAYSVRQEERLFCCCCCCCCSRVCRYH